MSNWKPKTVLLHHSLEICGPARYENRRKEGRIAPSYPIGLPTKHKKPSTGLKTMSSAAQYVGKQ